MIDVKLSGLHTYSTKLTSNKNKIDTESAALNNLLNTLPAGAWDDPEQRAFLNNLQKFYESAKVIQEQMQKNVDFVNECHQDYSNALTKALNTLV